MYIIFLICKHILYMFAYKKVHIDRYVTVHPCAHAALVNQGN